MKGIRELRHMNKMARLMASLTMLCVALVWSNAASALTQTASLTPCTTVAGTNVDGTNAGNADPVGRASFGLYRGSPRHIYSRER